MEENTTFLWQGLCCYLKRVLDVPICLLITLSQHSTTTGSVRSPQEKKNRKQETSLFPIKKKDFPFFSRWEGGVVLLCKF